MSGGPGAFHCKAHAEVDPPGVKSVKLKLGQGSLVTYIVLTKYYSKGLLLAQFNLHGLVFSETTVEDRGSKLQCGSYTCLVHSAQLVSGGTKGLEPDENPQLLGCSHCDVIDMSAPTEVTGDGNT